ncbi:hypothetical protein EZV62_022527 [Acer yangbiense]|uniref:hAT-like transposase RNase-H fold domain-containing protein n=1 Tax=Acer yangbiense TaxID=1000413 RepID=A0A5C7H8K6_9ROSI|nr:hypothetical protein EZV62_022527 [Acer yangbiense]
MMMLDENTSRIALTTDMWTSNQKKGYMVVTTHLIDNTWKLRSRILRFIYVPSPHNAITLADELWKCLLDWNVDGKLSALTIDNCTANDAMIKNYLLPKFSTGSLLLGGKLFHMRCSAHILNLIVKNGLDVIGDELKKLEKRWNSTYMMLEVALVYKEVFIHLQQRDNQYKNLSSESQWELAKRLRYKMDLIDYFFPRMYGIDCELETQRIFELCIDLASEYQAKEKGGLGEDIGESGVGSGFTSSSSSSSMWDVKSFESYKRKHGHQSFIGLDWDPMCNSFSDNCQAGMSSLLSLELEKYLYHYLAIA